MREGTEKAVNGGALPAWFGRGGQLKCAALNGEGGIGRNDIDVVGRDLSPILNLLDGHLRIQVLKDSGIQAVVCLVATDDEAYTYNKRVNRLAIIQEHRMILTALQKGVSEERLARAS